MTDPNSAAVKPCRRCKDNEATLKVRGEAICSSCYLRYVNNKCVKRLEKFAAEIRAAPAQTKRVLVGLSFGPSSTALVDILKDQMQSHLKKSPTCSPAFDFLVVHVDTDLSATAPSGDDDSSPSQKLLHGFAEHFPLFKFLRVPLTAVLELDTIDWSALPAAPDRDPTVGAAKRLREMFTRLPSTTSKADMLRLLVRHLLISTALREGCSGLVLGCSTTALAELTLGETAKGRGFSIPWMASDGPLTIQRFQPPLETTGEGTAEDGSPGPTKTTKLSVWYPNRELFRNELVCYTTLVEPPLTELISATDATGSSAVVSHRDVSIDDVMTRYFADVELQYPSIVANVVRTTGKLERKGGEEEECCGLCGMTLDELGDERWKGEMGEDEEEDGRLCYGCTRALRG
ncbi:unnamed protein product [Discula destructiva]